MPTLEEFIAACVATVAERRARKEADEAERERQFQELLQRVKVSLRARIAAEIPQSLRQFADYAGEQPKLEELQGYPNRWTPSSFKVEAPGLALIEFSTTTTGPDAPLEVREIQVGAKKFGVDWIEAVAEAASLAPSPTKT